MSDGFGYLKKKLYLCHMKQKKQTYQLLHLKELPLSKMVELYHDYASSHGLHKHQERKIYEGIEMLIHFIAKQQITNSEEKENEYKLGLAEINYDIADKVIGDVFQDVITFRCPIVTRINRANLTRLSLRRFAVLHPRRTWPIASWWGGPS